MRTIDPIPAAALLAGEGIFTARMVPSGLGASAIVYTYEINGLSMVFKSSSLADWVGTQFTFSRELKIGNTTYNLTAETYYVISYETRSGYSYGIAHAMEKTGYQGAADVTVYELLQDMFGSAVTMDNLYPRDVQFAPTGSTITLANKADIIPILERKYFLKCMRNGGKILFRNMALYYADVAHHSTYETEEFPTEADCINFRTYAGAQNQIMLSSYDEGGNLVQYFTPPTTYPIQNLGFLPQLVDHDDVFGSAIDNISRWAFEGRASYRLEDGDSVFPSFRTQDEHITHYKIIERYNPSADPPLQMTYSDMQWRPASSASSKGVDSPLSRVGADGISFETSQLLTGILDQNTNDVQHALELLSTHTHAGAGSGDMTKAVYDTDDDGLIDIAAGGTAAADVSGARANLGVTDENIQDLIGAMIAGNSEIGIDVTYDDTNGKLDFTVKPFRSAETNNGTLPGNGSWTDSNKPISFLDVQGADRTLTLPANATTNHAFYIKNVTTDNRNLIVKDNGGTTLATIKPNEQALFVSSGSAWSVIYGFVPDGTSTHYLDGTGAWTTPAGGSGSGATPHAPGGRLTLVTGTPVMTSEQAAKTSIYYTESLVPIWNGSAFVESTVSELTLALDSNSGHTGYHQNGKLFDLFVINDSNTMRLGTGPAWTSDTARGTGAGTTELEYKYGIRTNKNSMTLRFGSASGNTVTVPANQGTYVGYVRMSADGTTTWELGGQAANGDEARLYLYNAYNQVTVSVSVRDSSSSWTYNSTTVHSMHGSNTDRISFICEDNDVSAALAITISGGAAGDICIGISLDVTNAYSHSMGYGSFGTYLAPASVTWSDKPGLGYHFLQAVESQLTTASIATLFGSISSKQMMNLTATLRM